MMGVYVDENFNQFKFIVRTHDRPPIWTIFRIVTQSK